MLDSIGLPDLPAHQPYVLRRSTATLCRDRGATSWDLAGQMGHSVAVQTETYAATTLYPTAQAAIGKVIEALPTLCPRALHRSCSGTDAHVVAIFPTARAS